MSLRSSIAPKLVATISAAALLAMAPGWSGSTWASTRLSDTAHTTHHSSVSGTWKGSYSGSFSGTFKLTWTETKSKLSGTIIISAFGKASTPIHGTLKGTSIQFGTVGSEALTYSGSVSGSSMSGTWKLEANGHVGGTGSWRRVTLNTCAAVFASSGDEREGGAARQWASCIIASKGWLRPSTGPHERRLRRI
jgi:hypothetical protein